MKLDFGILDKQYLVGYKNQISKNGNVIGVYNNITVYLY